jgi:hypothetical protein
MNVSYGKIVVTVIASEKDWEMKLIGIIKQQLFLYLYRVIPFIFVSLFVFGGNSQGSYALEPVTIFICASQETGFQGDIFIPLRFLQSKEIKDELDLTDAQVIKINDLINTTDSVVFKPYAKHSFRSVDFGEIRRQLDEARRMVVEILRPNQMALLKSNLFLRYGLWSISRRDMRDLLHVSKMQAVKIDEIRARMLGRIYADPEIHDRGSSDELCRLVIVNNEKTESILAEGEQSVLEILTAKQREALNKLKEKPTKTSALK